MSQNKKEPCYCYQDSFTRTLYENEKINSVVLVRRCKHTTLWQPEEFFVVKAPWGVVNELKGSKTSVKYTTASQKKAVVMLIEKLP